MKDLLKTPDGRARVARIMSKVSGVKITISAADEDEELPEEEHEVANALRTAGLGPMRLFGGKLAANQSAGPLRPPALLRAPAKKAGAQ